MPEVPKGLLASQADLFHQARITIVDQFPVRALYVQVAFAGSITRVTDLLQRMNLE